MKGEATVADQIPEVNRALLTAEQNAEYDAWVEMFNSRGWKQYCERFFPLIGSYQRQFPNAKGAQQLGIIQGCLRVLAMTAVNLPTSILLEALQATGQLDDGDDEDRPDDLVLTNEPQA